MRSDSRCSGSLCFFCSEGFISSGYDNHYNHLDFRDLHKKMTMHLSLPLLPLTKKLIGLPATLPNQLIS